MLVTKCTCGSKIKYFTYRNINGVPTKKCLSCGVIHQQVSMNEEAYQDFYANHYHVEHQQSIGRESYIVRYEHDLQVARQRLSTYGISEKGLRVLDVGCGNGAFVAACRELGMESYGIDLGTITDNPYVLTGRSLLDTKLPVDKFSLVTLHDVLEHLVDPTAYLTKIKSLLEDNGKLIVDYPRYFHPAGRHHWRTLEHLWYHTTGQLISLLENYGFDTIRLDIPIPSKIVVYSELKGS